MHDVEQFGHSTIIKIVWILLNLFPYLVSDLVASPGQQRRRISGETRLDRLVRKPSGESRAGSSLQRPASKALSASKSSTFESAPPPPALPKPRKVGSRLSGSAAHETAAKKEEEEPFYDLVANEEAADGEDEEDEYDNHLLYEVKGKKVVADTAAKLGGGLVDAAARSSTGGGGSLSRAGSEVLSSSTDTDGFSASPSLVRKLTVDMEEEETNYVNIQYFLHHTRRSGGGSDSSMLNRQDSIDPFDEEEEEGDDKDSENEEAQPALVASPRSSSLKSTEGLAGSDPSSERVQMCRHILTSILESESIYLECLSVCLQYMKAMKVTLSTPSPVIPKEDFEVIFYKVPELYEFHHHFHDRHGGGNFLATRFIPKKNLVGQKSRVTFTFKPKKM